MSEQQLADLKNIIEKQEEELEQAIELLKSLARSAAAWSATSPAWKRAAYKLLLRDVEVKG